MVSVRQTQITSRQTIADTFVRLQRGTDEVTLQLEGSRIRYPVSVVSVDRAVGQCRLDIAGLDDIDAALREPQPFVLRIRQLAGTIVTSPMQTRVTEPGNQNGLKLRCTLPDALTLSRRRSDFRAAPAETMQVEVALRAQDETEYDCRLCNLSVGGCLISLAGSKALDAQSRNQPCSLRLRFPNGHCLEVGGYQRRIYRGSENTLTYIGVRFDADFEEQQPGLWFYVCEIEREAVRLTRGREGLRALAPSRLFTQSTRELPDKAQRLAVAAAN